MRQLAPSWSPPLLALGVLLAAVATGRAESAGRRNEGDAKAGDCAIVDYRNANGGAYTWYYCPSSRIFVQETERRIVDFDTGIETRVLHKDKKVQTVPIAVKQEWRRPELARRDSFSITPTGKTDVIAGVPAQEYVFRMTYGKRPTEVPQWFATDLPVPGRDKALAADIDAEFARRVPPGLFLRSSAGEATSVRRGTPPEAVLAIPADYEKVRWSVEKKDWVAEGK